MDPVVWSLVIAWIFIRYVVGDLIEACTGRPSPRTTQRQARQQAQKDRAAAGLGPTLGEAVSGRLANRILNPPPKKPHKPRGPAGQFMADWWADTCDEARERTRRARQRRLQRRNDDPTQRPQHDPDDIVDAEIVDPPIPGTDTPPQPNDSSTAPPTPLHRPDQPTSPAPDSPREGDPMSQPNGETVDPTSALAFTGTCKSILEQMLQQAELSIATLTEKGVAGAPIEKLEHMRENLSLALGSAQEAERYFEEHKTKQDELGSDDTLAGTQKDGYLDGAAA
jgi:hypothetical protein